MTHNMLNPFVPCSASIFLNDNPLTSTYCMREKGHADEQVKGFPGGHNTVDAAPVPVVKEQ
jgi:hypothetical protein